MTLNAAKASPTALLSAARSHLEKKQYRESESYIAELLRRNADDHAAIVLMGEIYMAHQRRAEASNAYAKAISIAPFVQHYKERFVALTTGQTAAQYSQPLEQIAVECLKSGKTVDCQLMWMLWTTHLYLIPDFRAAYDLGNKKDFDPENAAAFEKIADFKPLLTPYFLYGLRHMVIYKPLFEEFLTHIRRHLLTGRVPAGDRLPLAAALACYCFNTDYVFDTTAAEDRAVGALRARLEAGDMDAEAVAVFACYVPLYTLKNADIVAEKFTGVPDIADVVEVQIRDYNDLQKTAATVAALTDIDDAVSNKVRAQYETYPFPRWKSFSVVQARAGWSVTSQREEGHLRDRKIKILVAGCGTGQEAIDRAQIYPKAEVLAVDLSRTSLAYAIRKTEEFGIRNITFRQADILKLDTLDRKFDFITSGGVLHHLQDPVKGWRILTGLLKPDGLMRLGLYSRHARRHLLAARELIAREGFGSDAAGMKAFRRRAPQLLEKGAFEEVCRFRDYYYLNMCRDLLFHVQEKCYDLTEIKSILRELGMEFHGFRISPRVMEEYRRAFPEDPEGFNLDNWDVFEQKNPTTFRNMYVFWCKKA